MKKAKFMLTGLAVMAVVGGALAFKAKTVDVQNPIYCSIQGVCTWTGFQTTFLATAETTTQPCGATSYYTQSGCAVAITPTSSKVLYATNPE